VKVICPKCRTENDVPSAVEEGMKYYCCGCNTRFPNVYKRSYWKYFAVSLLLWCLASAVIGILLYVVASPGYSRHTWDWPASLLMMLATLFLLAALVTNIIHILDAGRVKKFVGVAPHGYIALIAMLIVIGGLVCFFYLGVGYAAVMD
jgi:hypothetical protein